MIYSSCTEYKKNCLCKCFSTCIFQHIVSNIDFWTSAKNNYLKNISKNFFFFCLYHKMFTAFAPVELLNFRQTKNEKEKKTCFEVSYLLSMYSVRMKVVRSGRINHLTKHLNKQLNILPTNGAFVSKFHEKIDVHLCHKHKSPLKLKRQLTLSHSISRSIWDRVREGVREKLKRIRIRIRIDSLIKVNVI